MIGYYEFKSFFDSDLREGVTGTWRYIPPKDKEQLLYDFYMLMFIVPHGERPKSYKWDDELTGGEQGNIINQSQRPGIDSKLDWVIRETEDMVLEENKKNLLQATFFSICAEMRHVFDSTHSGGPIQLANKVGKQFGKGMKSKFLEWGAEFEEWKSGNTEDLEEPERGRRNYIKHGRESYVASYKAALNHFSKDEFVRLAVWAFRDLSWSSMYGGDAWRQIAEGWQHLNRATKHRDLYVYIDHIYDLQHNTGTVFNKVPSFKKDSGYGWIQRALDHKRDIIESYELWNKISPKMRYLAGFALKAIHGTTWEAYQKKAKNNGTIPSTPADFTPAQAAADASAAFDAYYGTNVTGGDGGGSISLDGGKTLTKSQIKKLKETIEEISQKDGTPVSDLGNHPSYNDMQNWLVWIGYFLDWRHGIASSTNILKLVKAIFPDVQLGGLSWSSGSQHAFEAKVKQEEEKIIKFLQEKRPRKDWTNLGSYAFRQWLNKQIPGAESNEWHKAGSQKSSSIYMKLSSAHAKKGTVTLTNGTFIDKAHMKQIKDEVLGPKLGYAQATNQLAAVGAILFRKYGVVQWKDYMEVFRTLFKYTQAKKAEWGTRPQNKAQDIVMKWARSINSKVSIPLIADKQNLYQAWQNKTLKVSDLSNPIKSMFANSQTFSGDLSHEFLVKVRDDLYGEGINIQPKFDMSITTQQSNMPGVPGAHLMHIDHRMAKRIKDIYATTPNEHGYIAAGVALMKTTDLNRKQLFTTLRQVLGQEAAEHESSYVWQQIEQEIWDKAQDEVASYVWPHFKSNPTMSAKLAAGQLTIRNMVDIYHGMIGEWYAEILVTILRNYAKSQGF